ncbi:inosine/xanthosine triphosphatase [Peribacillus deserti]|uniref:Probable inosine/xanthosine triphosphatase n=1 Tax=Peribacillus deserti TaxID=673318 RepID=A0ABS2QKC6_9BACI|nr:inosine/xanthosine triphosphatase [Peribacillus deserti]
MIKAAIGSENSAKVKAVEDVIDSRLISLTALNAESGVAEQPFSDEETISGAINRAAFSLEHENADIGIGLEGGVVETDRGVFVCNWGALVTKEGDTFIAGGARIPLPAAVADRLLAGEELGPIMENYTKKNNIRKEEGAIGVFTNERIVRSEMFVHVVKMLIGQWEYSQVRR